MRVRFAPSPTGHLHVGNARTALFNWLLARGQGGTFILRIEDTDVERSTKASESAIMDDLRWMGLDWDEGVEVGGAKGPYRQSERLGLYRFYVEELLAHGDAYYCFCSAGTLEAERQRALKLGVPPKYRGTCRHISLEDARRRMAGGESAVVRFRVPEHREVMFRDIVRGEVRFNTDIIGDPVLLRSDGIPAYNYAVVIDDALMEISHVVRGEDHISNTPRQLLLYEALGWTPPQFAHLALVLGPDHSPLSKRHGATSVAEFRTKGYLPEALVNYLALIGWSPGDEQELLPLDELARRFRLEDVGHSAGVFDEEKLAWVNRHYLKEGDPARLARLAVPYLQREGLIREPDERALSYLAAVITMASGSVDRLEQVPARLRFLFRYDAREAVRRPGVQQVLGEPGARDVIETLAQDLASAGRLVDRETFRAAAARVRQQTGRKGKELFHPIRIALTGEPDGPELDLAVPAIEGGAELPRDCGIDPIMGARERAAAFAADLERGPQS